MQTCEKCKNYLEDKNYTLSDKICDLCYLSRSDPLHRYYESKEDDKGIVIILFIFFIILSVYILYLWN